MYKLKREIAVLLCFVVMLVIFPINVFAEEDNNEYISLYLNWDNELKEYTRNLCEEEDISYSLVLAIFYNESRFDDKATSRYGNTINYGLGQINGNRNVIVDILINTIFRHKKMATVQKYDSHKFYLVIQFLHINHNDIRQTNSCLLYVP